ncbi:hypothetical protein NDU88_003206 [Pleurodeles waltl]|uniref:Uncharacterized protein n=1 Tax=Pleurodeles waltl TaxID=8319 RepID=A0AAV7UBV6_PLEWA|nr:hypothetical protein NDU88_003206 [Pleurodeles waltl]
MPKLQNLHAGAPPPPRHLLPFRLSVLLRSSQPSVPRRAHTAQAADRYPTVCPDGAAAARNQRGTSSGCYSGVVRASELKPPSSTLRFGRSCAAGRDMAIPGCTAAPRLYSPGRQAGRHVVSTPFSQPSRELPHYQQTQDIQLISRSGQFLRPVNRGPLSPPCQESRPACYFVSPSPEGSQAQDQAVIKWQGSHRDLSEPEKKENYQALAI